MGEAKSDWVVFRDFALSSMVSGADWMSQKTPFGVSQNFTSQRIHQYSIGYVPKQQEIGNMEICTSSRLMMKLIIVYSLNIFTH